MPDRGSGTSCHAFCGIPEGLGGPSHASGGVFHVDKPLIPPAEEISALPDKDPPRSSPLCRVPCCLSSCQEADDTAALIPTHLPNIQVGPDDVPLLAGFTPASWDDGRVADASSAFRWLDNRRSLIQGLEGEGVVSIAEVEVNIGVGAQEENPQVPGQVRVGTPGQLAAIPLNVDGKSKDKTCP